MKTIAQESIIPYTSQAIHWHLHNNCFGLSDDTIMKIVERCNLVNRGEVNLDDEITPGAGVTVAEMLADLHIDYND